MKSAKDKECLGHFTVLGDNFGSQVGWGRGGSLWLCAAYSVPSLGNLLARSQDDSELVLHPLAPHLEANSLPAGLTTEHPLPGHTQQCRAGIYL